MGAEPPKFDTTVVDLGLRPEDLVAPPPAFRAEVAVLSGPGSGTIVAMKEGRIRIGRRDDNDLWLRDARTSGAHATIYYAASGEFRIRDLGSRNGTWLNGSRVQEYAIRDGDLIEIGGCVLRFRVVARPDDVSETIELGDVR